MFEGNLDDCNISKIRGWCKSTDSTSPIFVDIFFNSICVVKVLADIYRNDLELAGKGNGSYGFEYIIPNSLLNGDTFKIHVEYLGHDLNGSPINLSTYVSGNGQLVRSSIAKEYLLGEGIEIGALHNPLVIENVSKKYVDHMSKQDLEKFYSDIHTNIAEVDIIDDGETLHKIENSSQDFIIANHMLEHCENPIGTIKNHLQKLKTGGILFYSLPDKQFTFDKERPLTLFEHLMSDYVGEIDNFEHYKEWAKYYLKLEEKDIENKAYELQKNNHNIHFHVWDFCNFVDFLLKLKQLLNFEILHLQQNYNETIVVIRK